MPWNCSRIGYGPVPWLPCSSTPCSGAAFGASCSRCIYNWLPGGWSWLKGLIFGLLIVVISNWTLLPLIRQYAFNYPPQPLFCGLQLQRDGAAAVV